ncbi:hypothetical protein E2C01_079806 [Portunus trituberculatus]|uniref:Uncharacterized protein n=1 Tax=Portunus trituberculatus TaxID=210409 RepID=A0A5B7IWM2_PORTR|nr:hypothetical protein [Portunus trituberculatus]
MCWGCRGRRGRRGSLPRRSPELQSLAT